MRCGSVVPARKSWCYRNRTLIVQPTARFALERLMELRCGWRMLPLDGSCVAAPMLLSYATACVEGNIWSDVDMHQRS